MCSSIPEIHVIENLRIKNHPLITSPFKEHLCNKGLIVYFSVTKTLPSILSHSMPFHFAIRGQIVCLLFQSESYLPTLNKPAPREFTSTELLANAYFNSVRNNTATLDSESWGQHPFHFQVLVKFQEKILCQIL